MTAAPVLEVSGLEIRLADGAQIVRGIDLTLAPGEILGVVGESGSGKTTAALGILGYTRPGVEIVAGSVRVAGEPILGRDDRALEALRGGTVSYVPQDPGMSLNPSLRIGDHLVEVLRAHGRRHSADEVAEILGMAGLPADRPFARRYPHQLSGGQQQRVVIALALACRPRLVILDEPTTALDVVTQAQILAELRRLRRETEAAFVYVSHNLAVVATLADRVAVLYGGEIIEEGAVSEIVTRPRHPYTRGLVLAVPDHTRRKRLVGMPGRPVGVGAPLERCSFEPRCPQARDRCSSSHPALETIGVARTVRCFEWQRTPPLEAADITLRSGGGELTGVVPLLAVDGVSAGFGSRHGRGTPVVRGVSFSLVRGESLALVGESGSGKTTIARCVAGLHVPFAGTIALDGEVLPGAAKKRSREARQRIQIVSQNPQSSLNPRHTVAESLLAPLRAFGDGSARSHAPEVARLLELVHLRESYARRYPFELSGGERQRVAIARALAARPDVLVCDEITSALDVSVQAAVLEVLDGLQRELSLALLFVTHDLGVVASIAHRALVLENGTICEQGLVPTVLGAPASDYTRRLIDAAPHFPTIAGDQAVTT